MREKRLLLFQWGMERYGVPVDDVKGVIGNVSVNGLVIDQDTEGVINLQDTAIPVLNMAASLIVENKKRAIIMNCNGVQIIIIVDEVIKEMILSDDNELESGIKIVPFQVWKFEHQ